MYSKFYYKSCVRLLEWAVGQAIALPLPQAAPLSLTPPPGSHTGEAYAPCKGSAPCTDILGNFLLCCSESRMTVMSCQQLFQVSNPRNYHHNIP